LILLAVQLIAGKKGGYMKKVLLALSVALLAISCSNKTSHRPVSRDIWEQLATLRKGDMLEEQEGRKRLLCVRRIGR